MSDSGKIDPNGFASEAKEIAVTFRPESEFPPEPPVNLVSYSVESVDQFPNREVAKCVLATRVLSRLRQLEKDTGQKIRAEAYCEINLECVILRVNYLRI